MRSQRATRKSGASKGRNTRRRLLFAHSAGPQGDREGSGFLVAALRRGLGSGYDVRYPIMPDPDDPAYAPWRDRLEEELAALADGAILVGHSLGGSVLLKLLSERKPRTRVPHIAGLFLVATPFWGPEGWGVEEFRLRKDFAARLPRIPRLVLFHSRDDDEVPFAHLGLYARALPQATVRELDGYGHLFEHGCRELVEEIVGAASDAPRVVHAS
jgi:predicted alpha/beta hydrolase family esterase